MKEDVEKELQRDHEILSSAIALSPIGEADVDMQKYCAYLLKHRFLQKCPY